MGFAVVAVSLAEETFWEDASVAHVFPLAEGTLDAVAAAVVAAGV